MNKNKILIVVLSIFGVGVLSWSFLSLWQTNNNKLPVNNQENLQKYLSAEQSDKCQTPEGYTEEQWQEHMSHHPDMYKECFENGSPEITYKNVNANDLKLMLANKDFKLVDVHIPEQFHIPGTDEFIPYNTIDKNLDKLPDDKNANIVLYCRSGSMSETAAKTLTKLGYTNVYNLSGGLNAWKEAGYNTDTKSLQ